MYEIRPETLKTFVTLRNIKLPRFQRKQTWDEKKNFELCISVFKQYPIGVIILSEDTDRTGTVKWLLDGRQRRNALKEMYDDPEVIYHWAQKFIKFKNNIQPLDLQDKFNDKISEFLEAEDEVYVNENEAIVDEGVCETLTDENEEDDIDQTFDIQNGLSLLFDIIRVSHNKTRHGTGFTAPFDFVKYTSQQNTRLPYVVYTDDGNYKLESKRLKGFVVSYLDWCAQGAEDYEVVDSFITFLENQYNVQVTSVFESRIKQKWQHIVERINIIVSIDNLMNDQKIGIIEVKNLKAADSQKIFNLINSKGSPLKAVEILSARPKWNKMIVSPNAAVTDLVNRLYKSQMGITPEGVVRWDMAATFLRRISPNFIFKDFSSTTTDFEKELTVAFKSLSGIFVGGVTKIDVDKLPDQDINWEIDIDTLVSDIRNFVSILNTYTYFRYFASWKSNIHELTSDGVALEFLILAYKEYVKRGKPLGTNSETKKFQKYCFILWDKLVYEYINLLWKGSSDSKIKNDILSQEVHIISKEKWIGVLNEIFETNMIGEKTVSYSYMQAVLCHFYALMEISAPTTELDFKYDIDHIIPQTAFRESTLPDKEKIQDNLFNLAFLPKRDNISKSNKRLREIHNSWLREQISAYEFIEPEQYEKFSDVGNYKELFELRKEKFIQAFSEKRDYILNN